MHSLLPFLVFTLQLLVSVGEEAPSGVWPTAGEVVIPGREPTWEQAMLEPDTYLAELERYADKLARGSERAAGKGAAHLVGIALQLRAPHLRHLTLYQAARLSREEAWLSALDALDESPHFLQQRRAAEAVSLLLVGSDLGLDLRRRTIEALLKSLPDSPLAVQLERLRALRRILPKVGRSERNACLETFVGWAREHEDTHFVQHLVWCYRSVKGAGSFTQRLRAEGIEPRSAAEADRYRLLLAADPGVGEGEPLQPFPGKDVLERVHAIWIERRSHRPEVSGAEEFQSTLAAAQDVLTRLTPDLAHFERLFVGAYEATDQARLPFMVKGSQGKVLMPWPKAREWPNLPQMMLHEAMHLYLHMIQEDVPSAPCHTEEERAFELEIEWEPYLPLILNPHKQPDELTPELFRRLLERRLALEHWKDFSTQGVSTR